MSDGFDFASAMEIVARRILGEPNEALSTKEELRFGNRGSVSVQLSGNKRGTYFDNEGGGGGGVLDLIKARKGLMNGEAIDWMRGIGVPIPEAKASKPKAPLGKIVAIYDYSDERGELAFQVVRYKPKTFRQRRPELGGWQWNMQGVRLTIYRLPQVLEAVEAGRTIYITEGEKGVEALVALGLDATCSPGGAGKWDPAYGDALLGADVVVLPDYDPQSVDNDGTLRWHPDGRPRLPGQDHASDVARHLDGKAARVRVLMLPGLPLKGDVADWIEAGNGWQQLEALAEDAPDGEEWVRANPGNLGKPDEPEVKEKAGQKDTASYSPLRTVNPIQYWSKPVPVRRWIVDRWLPIPSVTLFYADGGVGKTQVAQQLQTACATKTPWLGLHVEPCRSFALYCEDDEDELWRRQDSINMQAGVTFKDLGDMRWASGTGEDNVLIRFEADGTPVMTERFEDLIAQAKAFGARLLIIDTAADTFGGNENDRAQVRQYIGNALSRAAREIDGAVLVNAHPSRTGLSTGNIDGGSTGWNNSARSRWSLQRPVDEEGKEILDSPDRILTRRKANYATVGDIIRLRWVDGVIVPTETGASSFTAASRNSRCEALFLELLDRTIQQGRPLSSSPNAGNFAPKIFAMAPDREGFDRKDFRLAMEILLHAGVIQIKAYGAPSKGWVRLVRTGSKTIDEDPPDA